MSPVLLSLNFDVVRYLLCALVVGCRQTGESPERAEQEETEGGGRGGGGDKYC